MRAPPLKLGRPLDIQYFSGSSRRLLAPFTYSSDLYSSIKFPRWQIGHTVRMHTPYPASAAILFASALLFTGGLARTPRNGFSHADYLTTLPETWSCTTSHRVWFSRGVLTSLDYPMRRESKFAGHSENSVSCRRKLSPHPWPSHRVLRPKLQRTDPSAKSLSVVGGFRSPRT